MEKDKTQQFIKVPASILGVLGLFPIDICIYAVLRSYRNERTLDPVFPSRKTIAKTLHCSIDTVDRSIKRLEEKGLIIKTKGKTGYSNRYQFQDINSSRTRAATQAAQMQEPDCTYAGNIAAPKRHQPESGNQNQEQEERHQLFHGSDKAYVQDDGDITIVLRGTKEKRNYGGHDDGRFRYGKLRGIEAKKAALKRFSKPNGWGNVSMLPTDGEAQPPHFQTPPFDNLTQ